MGNSSEIIIKIRSLIERGAEIVEFESCFKELLTWQKFALMTIKNDFLYRARKYDGKFVDDVLKIKYPHISFAKKNRFNDNGESMTYLSSGEIAPLAEIDVGFYDLYCSAKIQYVNQSIVFHLVGIKKDKVEMAPSFENEAWSFCRELITTKDKKVYNATIALSRILFSSKDFKTGIIYSSSQEDKTNQILFNLAIKPLDFDECCKVIELEYNILRYDPKIDSIIIYPVNKGRPNEKGKIIWELSHDEMLDKLNTEIENEIFKVNNGVAHYKFGGGNIEKETTTSFFIKFTRTNEVVEIPKSNVKNLS